MTTCTTTLLPATQPVQPLRWWTDEDLDAVRIRVEEACSDWVRDWIGSSPDVETRVERAHDRAAPHGGTWDAFGVRGEGAAWMQVRAGVVEDILHALFPEAPGYGASQSPPGIAYAIAARALEVLTETLRSQIGLDEAASAAPPEAALFKPWSGGAIISVSVTGNRGDISVLLNSSSMRSLVGADTGRRASRWAPEPVSALVPLMHALADRKVSLRIELSSCELDLGCLEGLHVGDIVPLAHSLDAPLRVSTAQGTRICEGYLGRQAGVKVIELVREASPGHGLHFDQYSQREA